MLLVPSISELEWAPIRPLLEQWAEVASFDIPGVGAASLPAELELEACIARALGELEARGWSDAVIAGDQFGSGLAVLAASRWSGTVRGLALGHACLHYRRDGERPTISAAVADLQLQLTELAPATGRQMLVQGMKFTYGDDIAAAVAARLPEGFPAAFARFLLAHEDIELEPYLRELDVPLLLTEHSDCALWTREGFEDAAAAFPEAVTTASTDNPSSSREFAEALREFASAL